MHLKVYALYDSFIPHYLCIRFEFMKSGLSMLLIITFFQWLAAFVISFIALMAVVGSLGSLPINFGTPGLVCLLSF